MDCQNEKKTTALTLTNFQNGRNGANSRYITLYSKIKQYIAQACDKLFTKTKYGYATHGLRICPSPYLPFESAMNANSDVTGLITT